MVTGIILILLGILIRVPSKELTTYSILEGEYSVIEEYVGGDAYNYIIGASLVAGDIVSAKITKTICIALGLLLICTGWIVNDYIDSKNIKSNTGINESPKSEQKTEDIESGDTGLNEDTGESNDEE